MDIGSKLREKRQDLGLSLEDASSKTLINVKYLDAIENNKFSEIPAETILIGFLRNYARILGINQEEVIAEYKNIHKPNVALPIITVKLREMPHKKTLRIRPIPVFIFLLVLIISVVLFKVGSVLIKSDKIEKIAVETAKTNSLEIVTTENVWIRVREGENSIFEGILPPNTIKTFESSDTFGLRIGNLNGISVSLNGKPVTLPKTKLTGEIKLP
ncbi:MAG: helix-turn-helix domain-containing protein [Elusimicrobia bacterium]|nr:helix-turn-helix domain-containing protein [Elusimicrobiota bacterium]